MALLSPALPLPKLICRGVGVGISLIDGMVCKRTQHTYLSQSKIGLLVLFRSFILQMLGTLVLHNGAIIVVFGFGVGVRAM